MARFIFHDAFDTGEARFDSLEVLSTEGERIKLRFVDGQQRTVDVVLDKDRLKDLVSWKMLF